ncbi:MAG: GAF domain-containing sensor histidine kinase [Patescibacteria group bacterium]|jgi:signal transduction histidine kinase
MKQVMEPITDVLQEQQRIASLLIQKDLALAETNDRLNQQVNQLRVLQTIINQTRCCYGQPEILEAFAKGLVVDLNFSIALILLNRPPFKVGIEYGYQSIPALAKVRQHTLVKQVYHSNTALFVLNSVVAVPAQKQLAELLGVTSLAVLPLMVRDKKYGVLIGGINHPYEHLSLADMEFLQVYANSMTIALESIAMEDRQKHIDALKSEFVSVASHQLRTPLSVIKWILKMVLDGDFTKPEEQRSFLTKAFHTNEHMIKLVNDLLDASSIEEGKMEYSYSDFNLVELVNEVLVDLKLLCERKQIKLHTNTEQGGVIMINADRKKIAIVFTNLISNAIKFTPANGKISLLINKKAQQTVEIRVQDTGIGMTREDQDKLFTKFFRSEQSKKTQTEGSGLGLFIVKNIMEQHNGDIKVASTLGEGTTFTCRLPLGS